MTVPTTTLPNGMKVHYLHKMEVPILYQQVQEYLRHGIELHPGDTLFDVGANIGLFSLWAYEQCQRNLRIYAFEPVPDIFEVLDCNAQQLPAGAINPFCCGLAQEKKTVVFDYYPNATALSTAYANHLEQTRATIKQAMNRSIVDSSGRKPVDMHLLGWLPPFIRSALIDLRLNEMLQPKPVSCQMERLSDIIRDHSVQQIDLLKIDVERSELDVLLGINSQDWSKIKQIVVEVHDQSQRVEQIVSLLKQHEFNRITIEQEPVFQGSEVFNLYALR